MSSIYIFALWGTGALIIGAVIGYLFFRFKYGNLRKVLKDPKQLYEALQKHSKIIDEGREVKIELKQDPNMKRPQLVISQGPKTRRDSKLQAEIEEGIEEDLEKDPSTSEDKEATPAKPTKKKDKEKATKQDLEIFKERLKGGL